MLGFSSEYSSTGWSAAQALGAPDVKTYGDHPHAWAPLAENGTQEYLEVGFSTPVYATNVTVVETDGNGFVTQVDLLDTSNQLHTVFSGTDPSQPGAPVSFSVPITQTSYLVQGVKIYVDTNHNSATWEEIDAVQLQGDPDNPVPPPAPPLTTTTMSAAPTTTAQPSSLSQWASSVIGFSSEYSSTGWSAAQALGAPDVKTYGDHPHAWAPLAENGTQEYLEVGFSTPVYATNVTVVETDGNGFVSQVDLLDTSNQLHTVFSGTDPSQPGAPASFSIPLTQTSYLVQGLKIYVDTNHSSATWEEIDAVQLQGVAAAGTSNTTAGTPSTTVSAGISSSSATLPTTPILKVGPGSLPAAPGGSGASGASGGTGTGSASGSSSGFSSASSSGSSAVSSGSGSTGASGVASTPGQGGGGGSGIYLPAGSLTLTGPVLNPIGGTFGGSSSAGSFATGTSQSAASGGNTAGMAASTSGQSAPGVFVPQGGLTLAASLTPTPDPIGSTAQPALDAELSGTPLSGGVANGGNYTLIASAGSNTAGLAQGSAATAASPQMQTTDQNAPDSSTVSAPSTSDGPSPLAVRLSSDLGA